MKSFGFVAYMFCGFGLMIFYFITIYEIQYINWFVKLLYEPFFLHSFCQSLTDGCFCNLANNSTKEPNFVQKTSIKYKRFVSVLEIPFSFTIFTLKVSYSVQLLTLNSVLSIYFVSPSFCLVICMCDFLSSLSWFVNGFAHMDSLSLYNNFWNITIGKFETLLCRGAPAGRIFGLFWYPVSGRIFGFVCRISG